MSAYRPPSTQARPGSVTSKKSAASSTIPAHMVPRKRARKDSNSSSSDQDDGDYEKYVLTESEGRTSSLMYGAVRDDQSAQLRVKKRRSGPRIKVTTEEPDEERGGAA